MTDPGGILSLPCEIIRIILENEDLSSKDTVSLALTCKSLKQVIFTDNMLWKVKVFQRWPYLENVYPNHEKVTNWFSEVQTLSRSRASLMHGLSTMSQRYYVLKNVSRPELKEYDPLFRPEQGASKMAFHMLSGELAELIEDQDVNKGLTLKHYANSVLTYMTQIHFTEEWHKFLQLPAEKQLLESVLVMTSQWFQTTKRIKRSEIDSMIHELCEQVKETLIDGNRTHPFFKISEEQLDFWRNNNIENNHWPHLETKQIVDAVCTTLFCKLGFRYIHIHFGSMKEFFIDKVLELKVGTRTAIYFVVDIICRRFGVKCEYTHDHNPQALLVSNLQYLLLRCRIEDTDGNKVRTHCISGTYGKFRLTGDSGAQAKTLMEVLDYITWEIKFITNILMLAWRSSELAYARG